MADLEDGEILESSDEDMQNETTEQTKNKTHESTGVPAEVPSKESTDYRAFTSRQETSSRISAIKSAESSGYRSNTPDTIGSDSSHDSGSDEDTPLWRQKKAKYFRSQKEQGMVVCPSPTLPEYKPQSPQTSQQEPPAKKRKNKNNVWGSVLLEQDLSQSMAKGGQMLEKNPSNYVERSVESYDFDIKKYQETVPDPEEGDSPEKVESNDPFAKVIDSYTSKVSRSLVDYEEGFEDLNPGQSSRRGVKRKSDVKDRLGAKPDVKDRLGAKSDVTDRLGDKSDVKDRLGSKMKDRLGKEKVEAQQLGEVNLSVEMEEAELTQKIAEYLHEAKVEIIERVISCLGKEEAIDLVCKTRDVEAAGGMMTKDGERRRTPGGVFIQLMKFSPKFTQDVSRVIFKEDIEEKQQQRKEQRKMKRKNRREKQQRQRRNYELKMQRSSEKQNQPKNSESQIYRNGESLSNQKPKERPRSWSTESEASSSENEMDSSDKRAKNRTGSGALDFQAELENTRNLILRSKSKENTDCAMDEEPTDGMKEAKSLESLPEDKENMEESNTNDLLEEESNVIDVPLE